MRFTADSAFELSGLIHDSALDPTLWRSTLARLAEFFEARVGAFVRVKVGPPPFVLDEIHVGHDPTPEQLELYNALQADDPRAAYALQSFGRAFASNLVIAPEVMRASAMYQQLLGPYDFEYTLSLPELVDERVAVGLSVVRGRNDRPFEPEEVEALQRLRPTLSRALRVQLRIGQQAAMKDDLRTALERIPVGICLTDVDGKLTFATRLAQDCLEAGDGLRLRNHHIVADDDQVHGKLQTILRSAARAAGNEGLLDEDTLRIQRPSKQAAYELLVSPLRSGRLGVWLDRPCAMIILHDPARTPAVPEKLVQALYGLSPAEARLSAAIARGGDLRQYARAHSISVETARSQLKSAMNKTGTKRQVDLSRLLLTGPAAYALLSDPSELPSSTIRPSSS